MKHNLLLLAITLLALAFSSINCIDNPSLSLEQERGFLELKNRLPLYLSVVADHDSSQDAIRRFAVSSLKMLADKYENDANLLKALQLLTSSYNTELREPPSWHITTLYIGNNKSKLETDYFKKFREGKHIPMVSKTFLYVPHKLMAAAVFPNPNEILIENHCPHITLFLDEWTAVDSNFVLQDLFYGGPLEREYNERLFAREDFTYINKFENHVIKGQKVDVYIVSYYDPVSALNLDGVCKKMNF